MPHIKQALCDAAMVSENWKYSLRDLPELLDTVCAYYKRALMWTALPRTRS